MNDLHLPPPHQPRREQVRRSEGEHDAQREENMPADAPDVENGHPTDIRVRVPTRLHPKGT